MTFKAKLYTTIIISFILLSSSLYLSTKSIDSTNDMINIIENKHLKFSSLSTTLNHDVEMNQADLLHSIVLDDTNAIVNINNSFNNLYKLVNTLDKFYKDNNININEVEKIISIIKNRIIAYKLVQESLIDAFENKDKEDILDSLIGFNAITIKFSEDINKLISISNVKLNDQMLELKKSNENSKENTVYLFIISFILILSAIYKLTQLQHTAQKELKRAEDAERTQKKLQEQLLKYNDDLEEEIAKKTKELHTKIYTSFISGLANRNKLLEDTYEFRFKQMALLNIDKFQKFNDVYGEETGNVALKLSAKFLEEQIDDEYTLIYHIGGDEFVFAVKDSSPINNNQFISKIENILSLYKKESFIYEDKSFNFMISAGISFSGKKKMLAYADMALKDAKNKNIQLALFHEDNQLEKSHKDDIECHKKLLNALDSGNIISHFQPIAPIQDSSLAIKYESLVRMQLEDKSIIPPFQFLEIAKQNRIYHKITKHIVINTLYTISQYSVPCSLNISIDDIENEKTVQMLYSMFDEFKYNHLLTIELLETEDFKDYETVYNFCTKIRSYGIKIALDDFGAGYSNFSHILNLPIDYIKIDASLISNIDRDTHSQIMVETIVGLATKLNIKTIAEFVSSKEILDIVKKLDIDYAQGYYIGKPENIKKHLPYLLD